MLSIQNLPARRSAPMLAAALLALSAATQAAHAKPISLWYSSARGDNFTAASGTDVQNAKQAGYYLARNQGYLLDEPRSDRTTVELWYHGGRGDNFSAVTSAGKNAAYRAGYHFAGLQGYAYKYSRAGTVAMKLWYHDGRGDNFSTTTAAGENAARAAGYRFVRTQGYVYPTSRATHCVNQAKESLASFAINAPKTVFNAHETLSWSFSTPADCDDLTFYLFDQEIPATGSRQILPDTTKTYDFNVSYGGVNTTLLSQQTVVRAKIITYPQAEDPIGSANAAEQFARRMLDNMYDINRETYLGFRIDIHLIPASLDLADLPVTFQNHTDIPPLLRGAGGERDRTTKTIHMAVAEEELIDIPGYDAVYPLGYVMFHEMAQTILGTVKRLSTGKISRKPNGEPIYDLFAFREGNFDGLKDLHEERRNDPSLPWLGESDGMHTRDDFEEYFAESLAAYFVIPISSTSTDYHWRWLNGYDLEMYFFLDRLFPLQQICTRDPLDPICV